MDTPNPELQEQRRIRQQAKGRARDLLDAIEARDFSDVDVNSVREAEREADREIAVAERADEKIEKMLAGDADGLKAGRRAFVGVDQRDRLTGGGAPAIRTDEENTMDNNSNFDPEQHRALDNFIRYGTDHEETRSAAQSIGAASEGGVLASTVLGESLWDVDQAFGGVRDLNVFVERTPDGQDMKVPIVDEPTATAEIVPENSTISNTTAITFRSVTMRSHEYQAGPVTLSRRQVRDSQRDVVGIVVGKLQDRIRRAVAQDLAGSTATSSTAPNGLVSASVSTGAATMVAGATNVGLTQLRDLRDAVDPVYRRNGEYAVSPEFHSALADLEDADNRPLFGSVEGGEPLQFQGFPIRMVNDLGDVNTSSQVPALFGDFSGFAVRDVMQVEIQRLSERFAENSQVGFIARASHDARPRYSTGVSSTNRPVRALKTTT